MRLGQIAAQYLGRLPAGKRDLAASEINRFVRHVGPDRPVTQITKLEVERYQQYLADTAGDSATRVESLKTFLSDLKSKKFTETNLGAGLRVRRRGGAGQARKEEAKVVELTREGLDQLQSELQHLETVVAPAVRDDLAAAYQDRDFRENAPYDEAKRRMGEVQGQIDRLKGQIKAARVVERETSNVRAGLGSKVVLRDLQYDEELDYTLVGPGEVDTRNRRISIQSPVGSALKDRNVGDTVEVDIPSGKARYRIERIERAS
ncbi:MAG: transcription elongation factor GreA [Chloroflexi bacterium]|nr:MAG: transcription elongation factor GreA [Chloroflexota bacterium]